MDKGRKRECSELTKFPEADPVFTKAVSVWCDRSRFSRRSGDQSFSTRSETSLRRVRHSSEHSNVNSISPSVCQRKKISTEWQSEGDSRYYTSQQRTTDRDEGSDSQVGKHSSFHKRFSKGPFYLQQSFNDTIDSCSDSEENHRFHMKKVRPSSVSTNSNYSSPDKKSQIKSVLVPEITAILKDASVTKTTLLSTKHAGPSQDVVSEGLHGTITDTPEVTRHQSQISVSEAVNVLKEFAASTKKKPKFHWTLEDKSPPEDGETSYVSSLDIEEDSEPIRTFKRENQNYLFKHIQKQLRLKSHKSKQPLEEDKPDKSLPVHSEIQKLICRIWNNPNVKHVVPAILHKLYPLPLDKAVLWGTLPKIDALVVRENAKSCLSCVDGPVPKDSIDRKVEAAIKRSFSLLAAQLRISLYSAYASKALLAWLEKEQASGENTVSASSSKWRTHVLSRTAADFIHDAAEDSLRLTVKNIACLTVARRAIWLRNWSLDVHMKHQLLSLPYTGETLFGDCLEQVFKIYVQKKRLLHHFKRQKYYSGFLCYPHRCCTSYRSPSRLKRGRALQSLCVNNIRWYGVQRNHHYTKKGLLTS